MVTQSLLLYTNKYKALIQCCFWSCVTTPGSSQPNKTNNCWVCDAAAERHTSFTSNQLLMYCWQPKDLVWEVSKNGSGFTLRGYQVIVDTVSWICYRLHNRLIFHVKIEFFKKALWFTAQFQGHHSKNLVVILREWRKKPNKWYQKRIMRKQKWNKRQKKCRDWKKSSPVL